MRLRSMRGLGLLGLALILLATIGGSVQAQQVAATVDPGSRDGDFTFVGTGRTAHGDWRAEVSVSRDLWSPGQSLRIDVSLWLAATHLASLAAAGIKAD